MDAQTWATWVGVIAAGAIGVRGVFQAGEANKAAVDALDLARSAEERADRLERLQFEHADIEWEQTWHPETFTLSFRNVGTDAAHDVELAVDLPDAPRQFERVDKLLPREPIGFRVPWSVREEALARRQQRPDFVLGQALARINVRLTWSSEAGKPGIEVWALKLRMT